MNDPLGTRMKAQYEDRTRFLLPRRTYTVVRIDGKAFHTYTSRFERPFDTLLSNAIDSTAIALVKGIQGAKFAYAQSDEISILMTDHDNIQTEAWFDGNLQKIVSVAASIATAEFNEAIFGQAQSDQTATFDARAFTIPDRTEVMNYFVWRQQDAARNSVQQVAQSLYSHKELHGKSSSELQDMIHAKGQNWNDYPPRNKRGAAIIYVPIYISVDDPTQNRYSWIADPNTPVFTKDWAYLERRIPVPGYTRASDKEASGTRIGEVFTDAQVAEVENEAPRTEHA